MYIHVYIHIYDVYVYFKEGKKLFCILYMNPILFLIPPNMNNKPRPAYFASIVIFFLDFKSLYKGGENCKI